MEVTARLRYLQGSPQKVRLVADLVRGKGVQEAVNILRFTNKAAARDLQKLPEVGGRQRGEPGRPRRRRRARTSRRSTSTTGRWPSGSSRRRWAARSGSCKRQSHITIKLDTRKGDGQGVRREDDERWVRRRTRTGFGSASTRPGTRAGTAKNYAETLHDDLKLRDDLKRRLGHAGVSEIDIERAANKLRVDDLHLAAGHHHRPQGRRGRQAARRAAEADGPRGLHQHPGDPASGARRPAGGRVDRRPARAPHRLPPRHEEGHGVGLPLRRQGDQDPGRRPPGRRRDRALRVVPGRAPAAPHAQGRHRLRLRRGAHDLRHDRREGVGLQGRPA